jgi:hypothetical protein
MKGYENYRARPNISEKTRTFNPQIPVHFNYKGVRTTSIRDGAVTYAKLAATTIAAFVLKTLFDANSILKADTDDTPIALVVDASTIVGRKSTGGIVALTVSDILTLIGVEAGATKYPDTGEQAFLDADHTKLDGIEAGADVTASHDPKAHKASHAVGGTDTVFPADPNADKYLMWDDSAGAFVFADAGGSEEAALAYALICGGC